MSEEREHRGGCGRDPLSLTVRYPGKLDDGRFDWKAPRSARCEKCKDRHPTDVGCETFRSAQVERMKTDMPAFFWHSGYRRAPPEPLYDTEPLVRPSDQYPPVAPPPLFANTRALDDRKKGKPPGRHSPKPHGEAKGPGRRP